MDNSGGHIAVGVLAIVIGVWAVFAILYLIGGIRIMQKAGYSGWMVLLWIIPIVNIIWFFVFAFGKWPIYRELEALRGQNRGYGQPPGYGQQPGYGPQYPQQY